MPEKILDVSSAKHHNKEIKVRCLISGKSLNAYCIPKKFEVICTPDKESKCNKCPVKHLKEFEIEAKNEDILKLIDINTDKLDSTLARIAKVRSRCQYSIFISEMQNIERIFILPSTDADEVINVSHVAYFVGHGLELNTNYILKGYTTVDPNKQSTTHVFTKASKVRSDAESFSINTKKHSELEQMKITGNADNIFLKLSEIYEYYSHNVTKIYNRPDLHLGVDLAFRSPTSFRFSNEVVNKGWIDAIVIGDTRCGKGYVAENLSKYFGFGEVVSAENATYSGLVGGLQQIQGHWVVSWGKIPLNDGGLVIVDEAGELKSDDWGRLSRVRSEGIAEITKIQSQVTRARTRLLFLCNPPSRRISDYSYGIQSLSHLIKSPEDIARFDYALVVGHSDVSVDAINSEKEEVRPIFNTELEHDLIRWIWSRKTDEIVFSKKAIKHVFKSSVELSRNYTYSLPLIQGENIRIKLAKLAVCFAARTYSNKEDGKIVYVRKEHVQCAKEFLNSIYNKDSSGYWQLSRIQKERDMEYEERDFSLIEKYFKAWSSKTRVEILRCLLMNNKVAPGQLSEYVNIEPVVAREIVSKLLQNSCIYPQSNYYLKAPSFNVWLKKYAVN